MLLMNHSFFSVKKTPGAFFLSKNNLRRLRRRRCHTWRCRAKNTSMNFQPLLGPPEGGCPRSVVRNHFTRWWQLKYFLFSPPIWGRFPIQWDWNHQLVYIAWLERQKTRPHFFQTAKFVGSAVRSFRLLWVCFFSGRWEIMGGWRVGFGGSTFYSHKILLMDKILHHQGWWLSHYL